MDDVRKLDAYFSLTDENGRSTNSSRIFDEGASWDGIMNEFVALLNHHGYVVKSQVIEIDHNGNVDSIKRRGRD
jgi:hypothetical protein